MSGLLRYAPRHFGDLLMTRGAPMVLIAFVFILPMSLGDIQGTPEGVEIANIFGELLGTLGVFFTLLAAYGLTGADVRQGFYRFVFAKPISPVGYYALSYLQTTVVFVLGVLATVALFAVMITPVWPGPRLGDVVANYFLLSALILVLSRVTNGDWLVALVVLSLSQGLRSSYPADESLIGKVLDVILPPTNTGRLFPLDGGVNWEPLLTQLGYSLLLFIVAMVVVRKVPMGSAT